MAVTHSVLRSVGSALSIREGEGRRTALLFAHLLAASAIFILGRTVRDTLFLSRYPLSALPWMFVLYGVASALTVVVYAQVADRMRRTRLIAVSCGLGAATYLATYGVVKAEQAWIYPVFYVWSEVVANLFIVQFWTFANDLNDSRAARRLFPVVGSARVLGVVLIGLLAGAIVDLIGTDQLILVLVGLMGLVAVIAQRLGREGRADVAAPSPRARKRAPRVARDPYVRALAVFLLLTFVALTIGDYQFKAIARETFREDELARFFSLFYAGTGTVSFLFQVFVTPRILRRFGVGWGMSVMPGVFGAASVALLAVPHLALATVMKFADNGFQYTVHETTLQALYVPFAEQVKARTRALLDAVVKPASYGVGGLVLVFLAPRLDVASLSAVVAGLVVVWLATIPWVRRRYVRALEKTLGLKGAVSLRAVSELGSDVHAVLRAALLSEEPRVVAAALEQLGADVPAEIVAVVEGLAGRGPDDVRALALNALARAESASADAVRDALRAEAPEVRAAAVRAYGAAAGDECVAELEGLIADPDAAVRVRALAGLFLHGGVEGALVAGARLTTLLGSSAAQDRIEASQVLRGLGPAAYRPVRDLLADPDLDVRRAALRAAVQVADARLVSTLIDALAEPATRGRAGAALVSIGEPAADALGELLGAGETPRALRLVLPRLLKKIPTASSFDALWQHAEEPDSHLRLRVLAALGGVRARAQLAPRTLEEVDTLVRAELRNGYRRLAAWQRARGTYGTELLEQAHVFRAERTGKRLIRILQLRYDKKPLDLVRKALAQPTRRANALELLDGVLEPSLRGLVMPWFDDVSVDERVRRAADEIEGLPEPPEPEGYLLEDARHDSAFIASLALDALSRHPGASLEGLIRRAAAAPNAMQREVALVAAARARPALGEELARELHADPSPIVRARASHVLDPPEGQDPMIHALDKLLLLKATAVFSRVEAEDLAPMAHAAEEQTFEAGDEILSEGEVGDVLYVVASGRVSVRRGGVTLATLGPGETVGEMAVLDAEPRSATVVAEEDTTCLAIASEDFYDVLREQVEIAEGVIRTLTSRLREADAAMDPVSMVPPER